MSAGLLALLGGVVGLDATSFPQIMISRPVVAGALAGALTGSPVEGLVVGASLEAFHLAILPIGAARTPEAGTATVAAVFAERGALEASTPLLGAVLLAVVFGLAWERVSGGSVVVARRLTEALLFSRREPVMADGRAIERRHLAAMTIDFARGAIVCLIGGLFGARLLGALGPLWSLSTMLTAGMLAVATVAVLADALTIFGGWSERRVALLLGVLCGSMFLLFR